MDLYQEKKTEKIILDEDEYIEKLEAIIERDYFPSILQSTQNTSVPLDQSMSIKKFFDIYNSEDNQSFEILQEKALAEKRRKFHWLYETPGGKNAGMLMWYHQNGRVLTVEDREKLDKLLECPTTIGDDRPNGVDSWKFRVRNQLMFSPELEASKDTCLLPSSDPSVIARLSTSYQVEDSVPPSNSHLSLILRTPEYSESKRVCLNNRTVNLPSKESGDTCIQKSESKLMPPPSIIPENTRLRENVVNPATTALESPLEAPHTPSSISSDSDNNYRSVCMTPSPKPGTGSSHLKSPLITWGDICGTPNILIPSSDENPFLISDLSDRDKRVRLLDQKHQRHPKRALESERGSKESNLRILKTPLTPAGSALAAKLYSGKRSDWGLTVTSPLPKMNKKEKKSSLQKPTSSVVRTDDLLRL